jgi:hypothetical protein
MRVSTTQEMEYLGSLDRGGVKESQLVDELSRQLDALRRFDQCFCDADWKPRSGRCRASGDDSNRK